MTLYQEGVEDGRKGNVSSGADQLFLRSMKSFVLPHWQKLCTEIDVCYINNEGVRGMRRFNTNLENL